MKTLTENPFHYANVGYQSYVTRYTLFLVFGHQLVLTLNKRVYCSPDSNR